MTINHQNDRNYDLYLDNISLCYGEKKVLNHITLGLNKGGFMTILGPSGCGKTSLLKLIAGLEIPTSGQVLHNGVKVIKPDKNRGMVFQNPALFKWRSVLRNISYGLEISGMKRQDYETIALNLLNEMGLNEYKNAPVETLSGGMQQRVALARALAINPEILLLDEPLGALDALNRHKMQGFLHDVWRTHQASFILVTHSVEEALLLGQQLVILDGQSGQIQEVLSPPFCDEICAMQGLSKPTMPKIRASEEFHKMKSDILNALLT